MKTHFVKGMKCYLQFAVHTDTHTHTKVLTKKGGGGRKKTSVKDLNMYKMIVHSQQQPLVIMLST